MLTIKKETIMSRIALVLAAVLSIAATAAQADALKDATRYGTIVTLHGVWDSR